MEQQSSTSKTHILDMNDSCLLYIFEKIDVVGLCAPHKTCKQFLALSVLAYDKFKYGDSFMNPFGTSGDDMT